MKDMSWERHGSSAAGAGPRVKRLAAGVMLAQPLLQFHHFPTAKLPVSARPMSQQDHYQNWGSVTPLLGCKCSGRPGGNCSVPDLSWDALAQARGDSAFINRQPPQGPNSASRWDLPPSLQDYSAKPWGSVGQGCRRQREQMQPSHGEGMACQMHSALLPAS